MTVLEHLDRALNAADWLQKDLGFKAPEMAAGLMPCWYQKAEEIRTHVLAAREAAKAEKAHAESAVEYLENDGQCLAMLGEQLRAMGIATDATPPMSYDDAVREWAAKERAARTSAEARVKVLERALRDATSAMVTHPRDWAADYRDAWLYGIIVGWDDASLKELADKFRWSEKTVDKLREVVHVREAIRRAEEVKP